MIVDGREKATITRSLSSALSAVLCVPPRFVLAVTPCTVLGDNALNVLPAHLSKKLAAAALDVGSIMLSHLERRSREEDSC